MDPVDPDEINRVNRARWDELASIHGRGDRIYDVDALAGGADSRTRFEREAVAAALGTDPGGPLDGARILHLQSHIAFDSISMARLGAQVTAVDFSPVALERARELAQVCGVALETVESDATDLPGSLDGRFDLVYASIGAICWIGDIEAWMRAVAGALDEGGALVLYDCHPAVGMLKSVKPLEFGYSYGFGGPIVETEASSYADADVKLEAAESVSYQHSIGELVGAALAAGLVIERLDEFTEGEFDVWGDGDMEQEEDGMWRVRVHGTAFPLFFTLIARKPAA